MKIQLQDIENIMKFYQSTINQPLAFATAYKLNKLYKELEEDYQFLAKSLKELIEQYGEHTETHEFVKDEAGNIKIQADKLDECQIKLNELYNTEIDKNYIFSIHEFQDIKIPANLLTGIDKLIKD